MSLRDRWRALPGRHRAGDDADQEIQVHLELRARELEDAGWPPEEARREAERLFGDRSSIADECAKISASHDRAVRRSDVFGALWQDLRFAFRTLVRSPGFAAVSIATLALGIGANAAIFSVTYGVLLRPLPYDDPAALVDIRETNNRGGTMSVAWANYLDWREQSRTFEAIAAYGAGSSTVLGGERPFTAATATISEDFWAVMRVTPVEGRVTQPHEHTAPVPPSVVIAESLWEREFGRRPISEITLEIDGALMGVVGVLPRGFDFPGGAEAWGPAEPYGNTSRTSHNWRVVGRLAEGTSMQVAFEEMDALTRVIVQAEPDADPDFIATGATLVGLRDRLVGPSRMPLLLLLGAAGLVLLVACVNLASTLLARGTVRSAEIAVRSSLGAGRMRVVRQLLTESLVLAALGGVAGILVALGVTRVLQAIQPGSIPRMDAIEFDGTVFAFSAAIAVFAALAFGLVPALRLTRSEAGTLRASSGGTSLEHRGPIWRLLVGTEVALALVLLTGTALLGRSFQELTDQDLGADVTDVITVPVSLSPAKYVENLEQVPWFDAVIEELAASPGITAVGVTTSLPGGGRLPNYRLELDGDVSNQSIAGYAVVSPGTFDVFDIPLLRGRFFGPQDGPEDAHVAIVSQGFAEANWPGEDPIGRSVTGGGMDSFWQERRFAEVVGVVADVRMLGVADPPYPTVYFPHSQRPSRLRFSGQLVVEAMGGAAVSAPVTRATIEQHDSDLPIAITPHEEIIAEALEARRFLLLLLTTFSLLGLLLAGVGIYGVVSYSVARRTREMGIRVALGADPAQVGRMVMASSLRLVGGGMIVGLVGSYLVARGLRGMLYGVEPADPVATLGVSLVLLLTAVAASWIPARVGTRADPTVAMRGE